MIVEHGADDLAGKLMHVALGLLTQALKALRAQVGRILDFQTFNYILEETLSFDDQTFSAMLSFVL